jgi:triphosphoribosyl-dephospho-CoA synthetase
VFSLADADGLAGRFRRAGFADVRTETLVAGGEFDSLQDYVLYLQEISAPINNLLAEETPERRTEVWRAVAEANVQFVSADGRLHLTGESILVVGHR